MRRLGDPVAPVLTSFSPSPARARRALLAVLLVAAALVADAGSRPELATSYPTANIEIDGHGFGHGRGMGQWGALGYALAGASHTDILRHFYSNTSTGDIGNPDYYTVRMTRLDGLETVAVQERGHLRTSVDPAGLFSALRAVRTGPNTFRVDKGVGCGGPWEVLRSTVPGPVWFAPQNPGDDRQEMLQLCEPGGTLRWLRGQIVATEATADATGIPSRQRTLNFVDMQSYLRGVVPRESPASWGDLGGGAGMNALRAQAVAARSYAQAENRYPYARTCDTTACQVYMGRAEQDGAGFRDLEDPRTNQAVDETNGQVRILNGAVARTEFSSSTGGYTAGGVFPAVVDEGDAIASNPHHSWHASVPVSRIESNYSQIGTLNAVRVTRRNGLGDFGGRALDVVLEGSRGSVTISGDDFRFYADIRSDWFRIVEPATPPPPANSWNGPYPFRPDGTLQSSPDAAAVRGQERVDVVVRGTNGFYWTFWNGSGWSNWTGLGSPPTGLDGDPTVVSWASGRLDVFVRGATDGKLWQTFSDNGGANWSPWLKPVGDDGVLAGATDGAIYQRFYEGAWNDRWLLQGSPPPGVQGDPATASRDSSRVDLFVRGGDDKLWQKSWDGAQWSGWSQPVGANGVLASSPDATSWDAGNLLVYVRGTDGGIYFVRFGNGWAPWSRLGSAGDVIQDGPGATSRGAGRFDVFVRGTDNRGWQLWR
ncbi:MAG: SpoIID/LytB domain-containing protein [Actinobacteria bacterium]|nr:SpoIID/LytB domain-containing protein [Actinomycetota bacterium]